MSPQVVLVDTNCYVRLYFSPLRPLLGVVVGKYQLMTLSDLVNETQGRSGLLSRHAWLAAPDVQNDLKNAIIPLSAAEDTGYDSDAEYYRSQGDQFLFKYCQERQLNRIRQLSITDAKAIAVALDKGYVLATDEWPLREFAKVIEGDMQGEPLALMSSMELLSLLLNEGLLTREQKRETVRQWILNCEPLLRGWQQQYLELFGEAPPTGQG